MISAMRLALGGLALAASGLLASAIAAPPVGTWQGTLQTGPTMVMPATLSIASAERGVLKFGPPASCQLNLSFVKEAPDGSVYRVESPMGGAFCDRLHGGEALLQPISNGAIRGRVRSAHYNYEFMLNPAAR